MLHTAVCLLSTLLRSNQCGLDHGRREGLAGHDAQLEAFRAQLHLGVELQRPVSVRRMLFAHLSGVRLSQLV